MGTSRTFAIDCFVPGYRGFPNDYAVVAVDVIRATTTAITAVNRGWRCIPVPSLDMAAYWADRLDRPLLAGELGGNTPYGFDLDNSPAEVDGRSDTHRPLVLLSSSGTRLMCHAAERNATYAASFRNYTAQILHLAANHPKVAVVGAGTRGAFREEDQLCCAWIAEGLIQAGYTPEPGALEVVERWRGAGVSECLVSASVEYLRSTGRDHDLEFILNHVDDIRAVFRLQNDEVRLVPLVGD